MGGIPGGYREYRLRVRADGSIGRARDELHLLDLRRLLARAAVIPTHTTDYEDAIALYRHCRQEGGDGTQANGLSHCRHSDSGQRSHTT